MITINLIKEPSVRSRFRLAKEFKIQYLVFGAVAIAVLALGFWYWNLNSQLDGLQTQKAQLQQENLELMSLRRQVQTFEAQKTRLEERTRVIEQLKGTQRGPLMMMNAIIDSMPAEPRLWLTRLSQEETTVKIYGRSFDVPAIADFIANLGRSDPFERVELDYWEEAADGVNFELSCRVGAN